MKRWTPKLTAGRSRRRIKAIEKHLEEIAYDWGDVDNSVVWACDDLVARLGELRETIAEARTLLEEKQ